MNLQEIVSFRREQLFEGAVQISWFYHQEARAKQAATSFVFHGPSYHGVAQQDLDAAREHRLTDTATFTRDVLRSFAQGPIRENPFTLAIAGYGTGKSHLGLTLAALFSEPLGTESKRVLENIRSVDKPLAEEIRHELQHHEKPFLVLAINGMEDFDLASKITELLLLRLRALKHDTSPLEDLRPRFKAAEKFVQKSFKLYQQEFSTNFGGKISEKEILTRLSQADEHAFKNVNKVFEAANGFPIRAAGQESLQDVLATIANNYCGKDGPFQGLLIIFDEFGRYLEFAVQRPHIAGSAALQQLFEGVQANSHCMHLLCFIQHELKAYISRVAPDQRDEINRYIGRFDTARKVYLSTNLETIFASLIEKKQLPVIQIATAGDAENRTLASMRKWFPGWDNHALWCDPPRFGKIVKEGCWPLHPAATWFLYRLASVGKSLQQRSAVSLLEDALSQHQTDQVPENQPWSLPAVSLCSDTLVQELIGAESYGQQAAIAHAFIAVRQRYEHNLSSQEDRLLRAVLIASKVGLHVSDQTEANHALALLAGTSPQETTRALQKLTSDYGVIGWNARFSQYEIIGDAVPRSAFDKWLRDQIGRLSKEDRANLFAQKGQSWSPEHLGEIKPDFAEEYRIQTREWRYAATCSCTQFLKQHLREAYEEWLQALDIEAARGQAVYCYIGPDEDIQSVKDAVHITLSELAAAKGNHWKTLPILAVLLHDKSGDLGEAIAEWTILKNSAGTPEVAQFANFFAEHEAQLLEVLKEEIATRLKDRNYLYHSPAALEGSRLSSFGDGLFKALYPQPICFPFDGYLTTGGNAAKDCRELTIALFQGILNHDWIQTRSAQTQNRANSLLYAKGWDVMDGNGHIQNLPRLREATAIFRGLQDNLEKNQGLLLGAELRNLCLPPYGCNLASAGLLLGLFISARREKLAFNLGGHDINPSNWVAQAFGNRNLLQLEVLDKTQVRLIKKDESDAWEKLLAEWEVAPAHVDKLDWSKKALTLKQSINVPGILLDRYQLMEERTFQAKAALEDWETRCLSLHRDYEDAYEHKNAGNLSRWGDGFSKLHSKMQEQRTLWTTKQFESVEPMVEKCRQAVIQFFQSWLDKQDVLEIAKMGDFRYRMGNVRANLQSLNLVTQAQILDLHVDKIVKGVEIRIKWGNAAESARTFLKANSPNQNTGVSQLNQVIALATTQISSLTEAYSHVKSPDILELRTRVEAFKKAAQKILESHKSRAAKIDNSLIKKPEDIEALLAELRALFSVFDGCQVDLSNFAIYQKWLQRFAADASRLDDSTLTPVAFAKLAKSLAKDAKAAQTEDDELPWDIEKTYETLMTTIEANRETAAEKWLSEHVPAKKSIAALEARDAQRLLTLLQNSPAYLAKDQVKKVEEALTACEARLNELQVDGLLAKFETLSDAAKREFMKKAEKLMK
jgi:hypothetical protein